MGEFLFALLVAVLEGTSGLYFQRKLFTPLTNRILRRFGETEIPDVVQEIEISLAASIDEVLSCAEELFSSDERYKDIAVTQGKSVAARTRATMSSDGEAIEIVYQDGSDSWLIKSRPLRSKVHLDWGVNFKNVRELEEALLRRFNPSD